MAQFSVNTNRIDPYKNFKFRVKWDGEIVAGVSKVSALKRTTECFLEHIIYGDSRSNTGSHPSLNLALEPQAIALDEFLERLPITGLSTCDKPIGRVLRRHS